VAYSGGADSTALLLLCARQYPGQVQAIHVHHGLQAAADDFAAHCQQFCATIGVPLRMVFAQASAAPGQSPEDAARRARYASLSAAVHELNVALPQAGTAQAAIKTIVIGQHADDQVETLLLALSRGAGLPGLSAMPVQWQRDGLKFVRPLLQVPGAHIREWLAGQGFQARHPGSANRGQGWVEDPTNAALQFTRNRIRHTLLPALQMAFPQFRETFARSAQHAAQAQALLSDLAVQDLQQIGQPPVIKALQHLSSARQANALRYWLRSVHSTTPSAAQLDELLAQVAACTTRGHQIHIKVGAGFVLRQASALHYSTVL
jgi:tRNA(Ile)-lysidine synthase